MGMVQGVIGDINYIIWKEIQQYKELKKQFQYKTMTNQENLTRNI